VSLTHADEQWAHKVHQCEYALGCILRLILSSWRAVQESGSHKSTLPVKNLDVEKTKGKEKMKEEMDDDEDDIYDEEGRENEEENEKTGAVDRLCLALGVLTNLVQMVEGVKDELREICMSFHSYIFHFQ
jgi:hypothetical protein